MVQKYSIPYEKFKEYIVSEVLQCLERIDGIEKLEELIEKLTECSLVIHGRLSFLLPSNEAKIVDASVQTECQTCAVKGVGDLVVRLEGRNGAEVHMLGEDSNSLTGASEAWIPALRATAKQSALVQQSTDEAFGKKDSDCNIVSLQCASLQSPLISHTERWMEDYSCHTEDSALVTRNIKTKEQLQSEVQAEAGIGILDVSCQIEKTSVSDDRIDSSDHFELSFVLACNEMVAPKEDNESGTVDSARIEKLASMDVICAEDSACQLAEKFPSYTLRREAFHSSWSESNRCLTCMVELLNSEDSCTQTELLDVYSLDLSSLQYLRTVLLQLQQIIRMEIRDGRLKNYEYVEQFEQHISVFMAYLHRFMEESEPNLTAVLKEQQQLVRNHSAESLVLGADAQTLNSDRALAKTSVLVPDYFGSVQRTQRDTFGYLMGKDGNEESDEHLPVCMAVIEALQVQQVEYSKIAEGVENIVGYNCNKSDELISQLQDDNIRLKEGLLLAHKQIEHLEAELTHRLRKMQIVECDLRETKLQNCSLTRELARLQAAFTVTQSECSAIDIVKLNEKMIEMEQQHAEVQSQLMDELRITEAKLMLAEDNGRVQMNRIEELQNSVADWSNRYDEIARENETLQRVNGEVHNLEIAIEEIGRDKQQLYEQLCKVTEERRQLIVSRDHLSTLLIEATQQNEVFEGKLQRLVEVRTKNAMKIIEMESKIKELQTTVEKEKEKRLTVAEFPFTFVKEPVTATYTNTLIVADNTKTKLKAMKSTVSGNFKQKIFSDVGSEVAVTPITNVEDRNSVSGRLKIAFNAIRLLEEGLVDIEEQNNVNFENRNIQIIAASTPWPSLMGRFHRYLRRLPHRRNAVRLYLRYLLIIYFVFLHGAFFRCCIF